MQTTGIPLAQPVVAHAWLRKIRLGYVPGAATPLLDEFTRELLECFRQQGHTVLSDAADQPDALLTSAPFGKPLNWRQSLMFTGRQRLKLDYAPLVFTILHATPEELQAALDRFSQALAKDPPDPEDYTFPGLAPRAYHTLHEQGRRGGPILALIRLLQSQSMCIRILLVIGHDHPQEAYTFDLVGAHPRTRAADRQAFYQDLLRRIVTAASTHEVTAHQVVGEPISAADWQSLCTPPAMRRAGLELGRRRFFTEMVRVANLVSAPAVHEAVSSQYSEGCFATWEPKIEALVTTITGSARPVEKDRLSDDDLAVIVGIRQDGMGARVRQVFGKRNDPPSSEAVELMEMDSSLPVIELGAEWDVPARVPVVRSKLHGHRGVKAYDPRRVEHVPLDTPYYDYPVSCSTEAQAWAVKSAFARSAALTNPADPRQVVFTVLPGHGVIIVEKWAAGKAPFQLIWEYMDAGSLEIDNFIPQGRFVYVEDGSGKMNLQDLGSIEQS